MDKKSPILMPKQDIYVPGQVKIKMSLNALVKTCEYIMENHKKMNSGDTFTITGTDGKKIIFLLEK